jgi:hypothetical protein
MGGHVSQSFFYDCQRLFVCLLMEALISVTCTAVLFYLVSPSELINLFWEVTCSKFVTTSKEYEG